ncbi:MAG: hypothetical protein CSB16_00665 [Clostridiales bacterium]|nr:MAG: hypothetical protein CSB16_00665 [Clostridiales bacterium]
MKKFIVIFSLISLLVSCSTSTTGMNFEAEKFEIQNGDNYSDIKNRYDEYPIDNNYSDSYIEFSNTISKKLIDGKENLFYSPMSLYLAMSMLIPGSEGQSRDEILSLMNLAELDEAVISKNVGNIFNRYSYEKDDIKLLFANSAWIDKKYKLNPEYAEKINKEQYASLFTRNLSSSEVEDITNWIKEKTGGLIEVKFEPSKNSILYLVNTIYYKAAWINIFDKKMTKKDTFHTPDKDIETDFMNQKEDMLHYKDDRIEAISKRLNNFTYIDFILPSENESIESIIENYDISNIPFDHSHVKLSLPKFISKSEIDFKELFEKMGISAPFKFSSDFSKMFEENTEDVAITDIKQLTYIDVSEEEVEAAATTIIGMETTAMPPSDSIEVKFDRPFIYVVKTSDRLPIFIGTMVNPTE